LKKLESSTLKDFLLARRGVNIRREQAAAQRRKDSQIRSFAAALDNGQLTIYQFLEVCSNFFEPAFLPVIPEDPLESDNSVS
jgi:DNA-binding FadR family transcriptional regulator